MDESSTDQPLSGRERRALRKQEHKLQQQEQRKKSDARRRNKRIINYTIGLLVIGALAYGAYWLFKPDNSPGQYDQLAQCLSQKGVVMYGTDWCPHCQKEKALFGNSFRYVSFTNCDSNKPACDAAGVKGYPTWIFPRGEPLTGEQPLELLAQRAGCAPPINTT